MKTTKFCLQACVLLTLSASVHRLAAQTLSLSPASLGTIIHQYDSEGGGNDTQPLSFATPTEELVNYNTLQITVNAPEGEAWNLAYDGQGLSYATIQFAVTFGNGFVGPFANVTSSTMQFDLVGGSNADLNNTVNVAELQNSADRIEVGYVYQVSGDVAFTGFTATITYDNSAMAAAALQDQLDSSLLYSYQPTDLSAPDPDALLTLQPAPEPSAMALLGMGGVGVDLLRLRRRS